MSLNTQECISEDQMLSAEAQVAGLLPFESRLRPRQRTLLWEVSEKVEAWKYSDRATVTSDDAVALRNIRDALPLYPECEYDCESGWLPLPAVYALPDGWFLSALPLLDWREFRQEWRPEAAVCPFCRGDLKGWEKGELNVSSH